MPKTEREVWIGWVVASLVAAPGTGAMTHINAWIASDVSPHFAAYWGALNLRARTMFLNECAKQIEQQRKEIARKGK